jgi:CRP-like cAMP-binding protein
MNTPAGLSPSPSCIGHLWVFANLEAGELAALAQAALRKTYKKGQVVFSQGDPANQMFLLRAGRVKLGKLTAEGNEITLDIRKAGDFLGESMLIEDADYPEVSIRRGRMLQQVRSRRSLVSGVTSLKPCLSQKRMAESATAQVPTRTGPGIASKRWVNMRAPGPRR